VSFWELLGRQEALDRRRQHGICVGVAIGRAIKLRQRQRGAQFETAGLCDCAIAIKVCKALLGPCVIGGVAFQQDLGRDTVHLRFIPVLLGAPRFGERIVRASEPVDMFVEINDEQRRGWFASYSVRLLRGPIGTVRYHL